jgi:hypothetical protein
MTKAQVCMFCRYRKSRARDAAACCAAQEVLGSKPQAAAGTVQGAARAMPERLRQPPPRPR